MKVIVYSTPVCPYCFMVKDFLKNHKIKYEEVDVSKDREKAQEMIEKSGQMGVPVTDVDGKIIIGFNMKELKAALGIKD